jgi:hypothetical protein
MAQKEPVVRSGAFAGPSKRNRPAVGPGVR